MKRRFYPSKRKGQVQGFNDFVNNAIEGVNFTLEPPLKFNDEKSEAVFNEWRTRFSDEWSNGLANVNGGNALTQFSQFNLNRLSYAECAFLASDSIINNAITKYTNEILRKGGNIVLDIKDKEAELRLKEYLEKRLKELSFFEILRELISTSFIYGGAFLFIDVDAQELSEPIYLKKEIFAQNKIKALRVVPPYLCGACEVETANPLNEGFMKPTKWVVSGNSQEVHYTRLLNLSVFEAPLMLKPLYNFLGISLCQFMKNYVSSADVARQSLSDMLLRFKSEIIKSDLIKINPQEAIARGKAINKLKNNNALILLTKDEDYIQSITPLSGLDKLIAQLQENVAVSARMPAVKLLGLTPSGFNATGDFDLNSYYDEIMSLQNASIKPLIERVLKMLCLEYDYKEDLEPSYQFEPLEKLTKLDEANMTNLQADFINKLIQSGVITQEQGFNYLKTNELLDNSLHYEAEDLVDDEGLYSIDESEGEK